MAYGFVGSAGGAMLALAVRESEEKYGPEVGAAGAGAEEEGAASADAAGSAPTPDLDPDAVQELADRIATLAALLHAGKYRLLALLAEFDAVRGWELGGHRSCAHWIHFHLGYAMGTSREHVRVARVLGSLPETSAVMASGKLSFSKVRALTRVASPETEGDLLPLASGATASDLEWHLRAYKRGTRQDEAEWERERHASRYFTMYPDLDGMYMGSFRLDPETGAVLERAMEAGAGALYRRRGPAAEGEAAQRRADAIGLVAERSLAAGFGKRTGTFPRGRDEAEKDSDAGSGGTEAEESETFPQDRDDAAEADESGAEAEAAETFPQDRSDAAAPSDCGCGQAPISGTRAERYQVMLHVEPATLSAEGEYERSELENGLRVPAETARRLACDAAVVRVTHDPRDGSVLDVGRKTRSIPTALRRALEVRDGGCRFPGCGLRFTDGHHLIHWAHGGPTNLGNTMLMCRVHHRLVHEGGWTVEWSGRGGPRSASFRDPRGILHVGRPPAPPELGLNLEREPGDHRDEGNDRNGGEPGAARDEGDARDDRNLMDALLKQGVLEGVDQRPDARTACASWKREVDIPDSVLFPALETL